MRKCVYCGKAPLPSGQRKYCNGDCAMKFKQFGPAREQYVYKEVDPSVEELKQKLTEGAWMVFRKTQTDEECIGDFMRVFKRAPEHCFYIPDYPMWKFCGPVWDKEELDWRWKEGAR